MTTAVHPNALDTSNYIKHTHTNPIQRLLIDRFHKALLQRVKELKPVSFLDAGCGEGFVADLVLQQHPDIRLTGFDFNPASVQMAREMNPSAEFVVASIFEIPFGPRSFDVTGCFEVLEHQTDPASALREMARVTNRALVLSVPHEPFFCLSNVARGKNLDVRPRGSDPDHKQFWTRARFGEFVTSSCPDFEIAWLGGSMPWTICVATRK